MINGRYSALINGIPVDVMARHIYDPDLDNLIALAQLVAAVCSETEADGKITTHGTGSKHRWTLNKLLKGAGPGSDPTEVDMPVAGKSIATGSYSGDNTTGRQVTVGFKCSLVIIQTTTDARRATLIPSLTVCDNAAGSNSIDTADQYLHASDGFVVSVSAIPYNTTGVTYYYYAISE